MMGAQASQIQKDKILSYIKLGKEEGAEVLCGGDVNHLGGDLEGGYYIQPTILKVIIRWEFSKKRFSDQFYGYNFQNYRRSVRNC